MLDDPLGGGRNVATGAVPRRTARRGPRGVRERTEARTAAGTAAPPQRRPRRHGFRRAARTRDGARGGRVPFRTTADHDHPRGVKPPIAPLKSATVSTAWSFSEIVPSAPVARSPHGIVARARYPDGPGIDTRKDVAMISRVNNMAQQGAISEKC